MSYGILRVQKFAAGSVKGIEIHDRREKGFSLTNPDIDFSVSGLNYDLCPDANASFRAAARKKIGALSLPKAVRKDAVVMAQVLVTSDHAFFDGMGEGERRRFFSECYGFLSGRFGAANVVSAIVHLDERTPHMHFNFVPVTADGRLCAKDVLSKKGLTRMHDDFHSAVGAGFGLMRGEGRGSGKRRRHLETAEFKMASESLSLALAERDIAEGAAARARDEASESILRAEKAKNDLGAIEGEIKAATANLEALGGRLAAASEEIAGLEAVRAGAEDSANAAVASAMRAGRSFDEIKRAVEARRAEAEKERRLSLLEKFVALPEVKPMWDRFSRFLRRDRGKGMDMER